VINFFDEKRQVGAGEAQVGGRDAMVLDVGRDVLMVRICAGQRRVIRVRLRTAVAVPRRITINVERRTVG
jgi:hypothetical protein